LLKDAPILLLDEPTEGLDARTEQELVGRLIRATRGKTVLLITHRPACLTMVERVVEMGR
jgi:ATP-binding cassette subfamily C protein CydC